MSVLGLLTVHHFGEPARILSDVSHHSRSWRDPTRITWSATVDAEHACPVSVAMWKSPVVAGGRSPLMASWVSPLVAR